MISILCETCGMNTYHTTEIIQTPQGDFATKIPVCPECMRRAINGQYRDETEKAETKLGIRPWPRTPIAELNALQTWNEANDGVAPPPPENIISGDE